MTRLLDVAHFLLEVSSLLQSRYKVHKLVARLQMLNDGKLTAQHISPRDLAHGGEPPNVCECLHNGRKWPRERKAP